MQEIQVVIIIHDYMSGEAIRILVKQILIDYQDSIFCVLPGVYTALN
ncbi:MAG: hypothetical protein K6G10_01930 [Butyrivibrio sp.]|nr:hypothetical protein [Butyrivibrio sp.]